MQEKASGQFYAPKGNAAPVCASGEFRVGVIGLEHGHIYGMCNGLSEAGAEIGPVWDPDPAKVQAFIKAFPAARAASSELEVLESASVNMVAAAPIPFKRGELGLRVMAHAKDYFCDKPPLTTREDVAKARRAVAETGRKFSVYYSERLHVEAAVYAEKLVSEGAIGKVDRKSVV